MIAALVLSLLLGALMLAVVGLAALALLTVIADAVASMSPAWGQPRPWQATGQVLRVEESPEEPDPSPDPGPPAVPPPPTREEQAIELSMRRLAVQQEHDRLLLQELPNARARFEACRCPKHAAAVGALQARIAQLREWTHSAGLLASLLLAAPEDLQ